jgi:bile acid:Na+ symporter, BASS family
MKTIFLILAITLGILVPYGYEYVFLIRYLLIIMLFFSFLDIRIEKGIVKKNHFVILLVIISVSIAVYLIINPFNSILAQSAFIAAIAPTAIGAPVVTSLKKGNVGFVVFSLVLNNIVIALLIPFLLPLLVSGNTNISIGKVLFPIVVTISVPFVAAQLIKHILPKIWKKLFGWKDSSFYILMATIYIAISDASNYIRSELITSYEIIFLIALVSVFLCVLFFTLGWFIGGKEFSAEASQALGQKNNAFTIWVSLSFISPAATLGPVFYVLAQNIYISWDLYRHSLKNVGTE